MRKILKVAVTLAAVTAVTTTAGAQGRGRNTNGVPPGQRPPDGMCRVWISGVAVGQQPAPTDCATARANLPANARVIYGGRPGKGRADRDDRGRMDRDDHILSRRRQLADGTWVIERYRLDASGNPVIVSTRPWNSSSKDAWKDGRKDEKRAMKAHRRAEKRQDKIDDRADKRRDDEAGRAEKRRDDDLTRVGRDNDEGRGKEHGKGKGKH